VPELSRFYGIVIRMFTESGAPHQRPHFHAFYQEHAAAFAIDPPELIAGSLPRRQRRLVEAWAELHQLDLSGGLGADAGGRARAAQRPAPIGA
jgi:hypothetical protein